MIPQDLTPGQKLYHVFNGELEIYTFLQYNDAKTTYVIQDPSMNGLCTTSIVYFKTKLEAWQKYLKEIEEAIPVQEKEIKYQQVHLKWLLRERELTEETIQKLEGECQNTST